MLMERKEYNAVEMEFCQFDANDILVARHPEGPEIPASDEN